MIYFNCDYMTGAHPEVLKKLYDTNMEHTPGYGMDVYTQEAKALILKSCGLERGEVYFLEGGTQANKIVIDRLLTRNDGVVCCESGHINVHESGAIEADGHKVIALPEKDGKLEAKDLEKYVADFYRDQTHIHMVRPAMVYISHPTEFGTLYTLDELTRIADVCHRYEMPLYVDGARLAYGLVAENTDISLQSLSTIADVFYIGGTKCGALFGEAVVTRRPELFMRFDSLMKLHGALLAKGRVLSVQFIALFTDNLYLRIGHHADRLANKLKEGFRSKGYKLFMDSPTNQQFIIIPNEKIAELRSVVGFDFWGPEGETESIVRFVTDWSTTEEAVDRLLKLI
ncbi:MAG: aminotransferase class I/II-fold pyridoxal phosphate-dependent enzyme [Bacteroides sp.]|nr:aminotransferase class I/II-fold pyridoxal phosphate-dependent enzyme [Bacteroides sp.]